MPRSGASGSGSGPRRPHEFVDLPRGLHRDRRGARDGLGQPRPVGDQEEHQDAALQGHVPEPDRARVRPEPVRAARVVGLEDRRGQQEGGVIVTPAQQAGFGIESRIAHQTLHGGLGLRIDAREALGRIGNPLESIPPPLVVDLGAGRRQADRGSRRGSDPTRRRGHEITAPRRPAQDQQDRQASRDQDQALEPPLTPSRATDEVEDTLSRQRGVFPSDKSSHEGIGC